MVFSLSQEKLSHSIYLVEIHFQTTGSHLEYATRHLWDILKWENLSRNRSRST